LHLVAVFGVSAFFLSFSMQGRNRAKHGEFGNAARCVCQRSTLRWPTQHAAFGFSIVYVGGLLQPKMAENAGKTGCFANRSWQFRMFFSFL